MKRSSDIQAAIRYQKRRDAVNAVGRGEPVTLVARVFNIPIRTLFLWLAWYRQGGDRALHDEARSGRPRKITTEVMHWLYEAITMNSPQQYQFPFCLWTLGIIRTALKREKGIALSVSGVSRLLRHLGLSPQRPLYHSYKQDPRKLEKYLNRTLPELQALARRTRAVIYFLDEASVHGDAHRGTTSGKIGETPVVKGSGDRLSLRLISAVCLRGDMKFGTFEGQMNSARFVQFLKSLNADTGKPIIVIMNNADYHHGDAVKQFVEASEGQVSVEYLSTYVPELNLDPQVGIMPMHD